MLLLAVSPATCFLAISQSALALNSASTKCASIGQTVCIACMQIHEVDDFGLRVYNTVKRHRILPVDISDNSGSLLITVGRDAQQPPYRIENRSVMHAFTLPSWHRAWRQLQPRLAALCMCGTAMLRSMSSVDDLVLCFMLIFGHHIQQHRLHHIHLLLNTSSRYNNVSGCSTYIPAQWSSDMWCAGVNTLLSSFSSVIWRPPVTGTP